MSRPIPALALGLILLTAPAMAQTTADPIPGVDIIVQKDPGGSALVVGRSGRDGWFRGSVRVQAGEYRISAACPPRVMCRAFRLASVRVNGRQLSPNADGRFTWVGSSIGQVRLEANTILQQPVSTPR